MPSQPETARSPQPALLPLHGVQDKKPRILEREATVVGRSRGCDVSLDAPDVSQVHCIVSRGPEGFRIRDCNSRAGTRINGENIRTARLNDGDIVQIGPFSFTVYLPESYRSASRVFHQQEVDKLQRSRKHLASLALRTRRRLAKLQEKGQTETPTDLSRKATGLKAQIRTFDQRLTNLEQAERELADDRDALEREREAHRARVQEVELDMSRRLADVEEEVRKRWHDFQQRCRVEQDRLNEAVRATKQSQSLSISAEALEDLRQQLAQRELDLREYEEQHVKDRQQLARDLEALDRQKQEIRSMLEHANGNGCLADHDADAALARLEAGIERQRLEMAHMMADLEKMQLQLRRPAVAPDQDLEALLEDNERLRRAVAELEQQAASGGPGTDDAQTLREENAVLRQLLEVQKSLPVADSNQEIEELRCRLQQKEQEVTALKAKAQEPVRTPMRASDLESYESELNQFRQQLEQDRVKLNKEIESLRDRNDELDDATREMEMAMSKERAELGRERQRLDRLREDIRVEMERVQREGAVRESLVGVNKLRDEMNQKKQPAANPLNDRLKNFRSKLSE